MIISCPSCATRYDVEEARFVPDGRSVRCAECGESWFVPAPEPIEDLTPLRPKRASEPVRSARRDDAEAAFEEDDSLFDAPPRRDAGHAPAREHDDRPASRRTRFRLADDAMDDEPPARTRERDAQEAEYDQADLLPPRDEKGRFVKSGRVRQTDEDAPRRAHRADDQCETDAGAKGSRRDAAEEHDARRGAAGRTSAREDHRAFGRAEESYDRAPRGRRRGEILDVDFEDVDSGRSFGRDFSRDDGRLYSSREGGRDFGRDEGRDPGRDQVRDRVGDGPRADRRDFDDEDPRDRGVGRKIREERRRATALMRIEDLEPVAERVFNDEFFMALRVQPRELERAIRKARRRAEAREKNRLTPWRALGWSAWAGVVAATVFVAYAYRDGIVAMFPNAAGAYRAVGISANPYGLKIENVRHRVAMSTSGPTIEITGLLRNEAAGAVEPPLLQAEALGEKGELLSRWTFAAEAREVAAGETANFTTRAPAPEGVKEVALSFAPVEGVRVSIGDLLKQPDE